MEFKQAYAPIIVGKITTFIPIERAPDAPIYVSVQPSDSGDKLVWSAVDSAKFYFIEQYINGKWEMVNANYQGTQYTLPKSASGVYRVTACDEYGCAAAKQQNRVVSEPFAVKAFYSDRSQVDMFGQAKVSWQISGAATVSVSRVENGRTVQTWPVVNPNQGALVSRVDGLAHFTLTAHGFDGRKVVRKLSIATLPDNPIQLNGVKGEYHQPLFLSGLDVVERSIVEHGDNIYFSTHDGVLRRFSVKKQNGKIIDWKPEWAHSTLGGVVNSAPVIDGGTLLYTISRRNNTGLMCRSRLSDGRILMCSGVKNSSLIASPVIVNSQQSIGLRAVSDFFTSSTQVQGGIYIFHRDGLIQVLDPIDLTTVLREYRIGGVETGFVSTPSLVTGDQHQFIMQSQNEVFGVDVPTQIVPSTISNTVDQVFGSKPSQTQTGETNAQTQTLPVVWRKKL
ncbi:hypothetical protein CWB99_19110 [Pseudoalteromonas rubra]|uniref:Ig-like domain-containing protein n=1 Tax=Pseudoalteromonas rubra TaxID=43658 RepID=A0A5S3WJ37_9GAMM|nr:hypothetical protein [Pseudoalteromonas rubra]TMP26414.1 hypothetical protein CWB99_19110 [Pseudoalteromonas rubra]TMP29739.1 hypothetical protein CWC00_18660 [Pseudoalteromonas rubra]